ncbi:MAG: SAM-dependent methyltransferase [Faecalicoccus sp.]|nr:SAM-dependent methyltransferase [Faecalicoccus sp.]
MIPVSTRLQKIQSLVSGTVLADIGCDHAYIAINSILSGKVNKAYACDIAEGPLNNARTMVHKAGVQDKVILRLQNGIENLPEDVDCIVIAGMGALTVMNILENGHFYLPKDCSLILSVHKDADKLRLYLSENGYSIEKEYVVKDDGHYYPIVCCRYTTADQKLDESEILYGKNVVKDDDYQSFIHHEKTKWEAILSRMPDTKGDSIRNRLLILEQIEHAS